MTYPDILNPANYVLHPFRGGRYSGRYAGPDLHFLTFPDTGGRGPRPASPPHHGLPPLFCRPVGGSADSGILSRSPSGYLCETVSRRKGYPSPSSEGEVPERSGGDGGVLGRRRIRLAAKRVLRRATPTWPPPLKRGRYGIADARGISQRNPWGRGIRSVPFAQRNSQGEGDSSGESLHFLTHPDIPVSGTDAKRPEDRAGRMGAHDKS